MRLNPVATLAELVAIPSVNPMGRDDLAASNESRLTDFLEKLFVQHKIGWQRQTTAPGRDNIVAVVEGSPRPDAGGTVLLFDAHQDTVPTDGMTVPPFEAIVRDGRLYGRGACDVKGPMAAMLAAVVRIAEEMPQRRPTLVLACTVNEEQGFTGVKELTSLWGRPGSIVPRRPDLAVVAEPTDHQVVVAHKGVVRWRCHAKGRAAHSSSPERGDSAIYRMARIVAAVERYEKEVLGAATPHRLCGPPTLNVGTIRGGASANIVPERCTIEIERRVCPGEDPQQARAAMIDYLDRAAGPAEHEPPYMTGLPMDEQLNGDLAAMVVRTAREAGVTSARIGVPYATDAAFLAAAGVPTVVFGPGSIAQAHTADEWIALDQVVLAAELYYRLAIRAAEPGHG